jgi:uncharacterized protein
LRGQDAIIRTVLEYYPDVQGIYLFGSYGTADEWPDSDVDIALLIQPLEAKKTGTLVMSELHTVLESLLRKDVDLVNLRLVSTVLQKEVVAADRRIFAGDEYAADEFEMLTLSLYQKLNEERVGIVADAITDGRFLKT